MSQERNNGQRRPQGGGRVPPLDAFDHVKKRKPPTHLPGYQPAPGEAEPETRPAPPQADRHKPPEQGRPQRGTPPNGQRAARQPEGKAPPPSKKRQRRRNKEVNLARRRRNRRVAAIISVAVLIIAGLVFSLTVLFKIEKYSVQGDSPYSTKEVIASFGHEVGENMFGFNAATAEKRIEKQLPYIEEVTIRRRFPGTVVLRVTEAVEAYSIPWEGRFAVLSQNLKVLRFEDAAPEGLTVLYGLNGIDAEEGTVLKEGGPDNGSPLKPEDMAPVPASTPESDASQSDVSGAESTSGATEDSSTASGTDAAEAADAGEEGQEEAASGTSASGEAETSGSSESESSESTEDTAQSESSKTKSNSKTRETSESAGDADSGSESGAGGRAEDKADLALLRELLKELAESGLEDVTWVDVGDPLELRFRWENRITVNLGARNSLPQKLKFVVVLFMDEERAQITSGDRGTLDVSTYPDATDRVWLVPE